MSSESIPANEYPDRVGFKPDNPYLATFRPYIPAGVRLRELTIIPLIMGTILGIVFGASSLYLVLKVGLTVSASIPVAVISITLFRVLSKLGLRDATILENNIVQTAGSAGESIAFGIGVTMPAILILGFDLELSRVMLVAVLGGLLGILMMIPLRRALIVAQHGYLKYPEGTACAEVLKAGASEESRHAAMEGSRESATAFVDEAATGGKTIISGFGIGFLYYGIEQIFKTWKEYPGKIFGKPFEGGSVSIENNPALLGVGYIIGPRIASIMVAGGVLAYVVLIPAIKYFGGGINGIYDKIPGTNNTVAKFTAPKATLMSYIIKGILSRELPWGLVLLGVMITIVLELSGVPSLAFAVGVYLPISTSAPIFVGGAVRWLVDKYLRKKPENLNLTEEQMAAETDKSPGVLLASGYIAGATLAGVIFAFLNLREGIVTQLKVFEEWATHHNPFFEGPNSDALGMIPFLILTILLYLVGRELVLKPTAVARREE